MKKFVLEALERETKPNMETFFRSLDPSKPKARVHVAPEVLDGIPLHVSHHRDNKYFEFVPLKATEELLSSARLIPFPVDHTVPCYGFRLDTTGGSLAYVTDTYGELDASYLEKIRGVDVLLHECACPDDDPEFARRWGHSHITPVAQLAAEAQVGRLILIHLSTMRPETGEPELAHALPIFPRTEVAFDRMEIDF
jgi:ribonuclease BN (tRNA processing enzyme)